MPVRLLTSSILKWPDAQAVKQALAEWVNKAVKTRDDVLSIGYFGSYARGNWGVGSDLDLIIIVKDSRHPFIKRAAEWDASELPVPADILVYTAEEWQDLIRREQFSRRIIQETIWVYSTTS